MKTITQEELAKRILESKGSLAVSFVTETDPRMKKTDNPFLDRNIKKISKVGGLIGFSYENAVNNQAKRENADNQSFTAQARKWGEYVKGSRTLIEHKGSFYVSVKVQQTNAKPEYVDNNGESVDPEMIKPFLPTKRKPTTQEHIEKEVVERDYKIESIKEIAINGERFKVIA